MLRATQDHSLGFSVADEAGGLEIVLGWAAYPVSVSVGQHFITRPARKEFTTFQYFFHSQFISVLPVNFGFGPVRPGGRGAQHDA